MTKFSVNYESLEAMQELLLGCAAEMLNAQFAVGPGKQPKWFYENNQYAGDVMDCINGGWQLLGQTLETYEGSMQDSGKSVENIATVLKAAIKHYQEQDSAVSNAAGGAGS